MGVTSGDETDIVAGCDVIFVVDTSSQMTGNPLKNLKDALLAYIALMESHDYRERITLITFGGKAQLIERFTEDYNGLRTKIQNLIANGKAKLGDALELAITEYQNNSRMVTVENLIIKPRIILFTFGEVDDKQKVLQQAQDIVSIDIPIVCLVGDGCDDEVTLKNLSSSTGILLKVRDIQDLEKHFIKLLLLMLFIVKTASDIANILEPISLRMFIEQEQYYQRVSFKQVESYIKLLKQVVVTKKSGSTRNFPTIRYIRPNFWK